MDGITFRLATEPRDYDRLQRFLRNESSYLGECLYVSPGDLDWWLNYEEDPEARLRQIPLWLDGDRIVGWSYGYKDETDLFVRPDYLRILPGMIETVEARAREAGAKELKTFVNERSTGQQAIYADAGYERGEQHYTFRTFPLAGELPTPILPDGFRFRDMNSVGGDDLERRVGLHRIVWDPSKWTPEKHARLMNSSNYRADLDLIVVAPNGDFAAYTILWFEPVQNYGVFEPVGCHPDYRQKGLTRALMHEGLRRLAALGADTAFVNSWSESLPANRLYEASGFTVVERLYKWTKALE